MLLVRIADGKSVSFSPLPGVLGEFGDCLFWRVCRHFPRSGELFIVGADKKVWRLPLDSVMGTLDWPVAQPPIDEQSW